MYQQAKSVVSKRKRGRPRKEDPLFPNPRSVHPIETPPTTDITSNDGVIGQTVSGIVEGTFDAGYFLTVRVAESDTLLTGLVFRPGCFTPLSHANDVAPNAKIYRRSNNVQISMENNNGDRKQIHAFDCSTKDGSGEMPLERSASPGAKTNPPKNLDSVIDAGDFGSKDLNLGLEAHLAEGSVKTGINHPKNSDYDINMRDSGSKNSNPGVESLETTGFEDRLAEESVNFGINPPKNLDSDADSGDSGSKSLNPGVESLDTIGFEAHLAEEGVNPGIKSNPPKNMHSDIDASDFGTKSMGFEAHLGEKSDDLNENPGFRFSPNVCPSKKESFGHDDRIRVESETIPPNLELQLTSAIVPEPNSVGKNKIPEEDMPFCEQDLEEANSPTQTQNQTSSGNGDCFHSYYISPYQY